MNDAELLTYSRFDPNRSRETQNGVFGAEGEHTRIAHNDNFLMNE